MEQTEKLKRIMILLQRKYRSLEEIEGITRQMMEALSRKDEVSLRLLLKMRAEEMAQADRTQEELWQAGEASPADGALLKQVMGDAFLAEERENPDEERIRKIRLSTRTLIGRLQEEDRHLNIRMAGKKSWYTQKADRSIQRSKG